MTPLDTSNTTAFVAPSIRLTRAAPLARGRLEVKRFSVVCTDRSISLEVGCHHTTVLRHTQSRRAKSRATNVRTLPVKTTPTTLRSNTVVSMEAPYLQTTVERPATARSADRVRSNGRTSTSATFHVKPLSTDSAIAPAGKDARNHYVSAAPGSETCCNG